MFLRAVSPLRRVGMGLALAAVILQGGAEFVLSTVAFPGGFPFGIAFIALLGVALSVAATIVLLTSLGQARREANGTSHRRWGALDAFGKAGGALGICYLLSWVGLMVLINFPVDPTSFELAALVMFIASAAFMAVSRP